MNNLIKFVIDENINNKYHFDDQNLAYGSEDGHSIFQN